MAKSIVVKKSPVVIVKNFILLQIAATVVFFMAGALADYGEIYSSLSISYPVSFRIAEALFILLAEMALVFFIFFRWYRESYHIRNNEIIHSYGILYRHETTIPLDNVVSVSHRQSPLGKLTKYGTVELISSNTNKKIRLENVPTPDEYVGLILKFKRFSSNKNTEAVNVFTNISDLLKRDEHENLEFKSTFRWDTRQNAVNKILEKSVMKTILLKFFII